MNGRQKIESALSVTGSSEFAVVIPYEDILIRDHWKELTSHPWWYGASSDLDHQITWRREIIRAVGQDWMTLPHFFSRKEREVLSIEERPAGVFRTNSMTGIEIRMEEPQVSGWSASQEPASVQPRHIAETEEELVELIPEPSTLDETSFRTEGRGDLASLMISEFGNDLYPICRVGSPLWSCYDLWGFEEMMTMVASRPDLVRYASERYLMHSIRAVRELAMLGAEGIWIEECLTDMIAPDTFASLNVPLLRALIDEIHSLGMKSIYYFCGNPMDRLEVLVSVGSDALAMEESKKGFEIDIAEVADRVKGRCTLLGNLDAIGVLQNGTDEELRVEVSRQMMAGRRNGSRFIMSLGSPVTPETPIERVRLFCDLARDLGCA